MHEGFRRVGQAKRPDPRQPRPYARPDAPESGIIGIDPQSAVDPPSSGEQSILLEGGEGEVVHAPDALGIQPQDSTAEGCTASAITGVVSADRQASKDVGHGAGSWKKRFKQMTCLSDHVDLNHQFGEPVKFLQRFRLIDPIKGLYELTLRLVGSTASEQRFGEAPPHHRRFGVEAPHDFKADSGLIELPLVDRGLRKPPVGVEMCWLDFEHSTELLHRFLRPLHLKKEAPTFKKRVKRRGVLAQLGKMELERSLGFACCRVKRRETTSDSWNRCVLAHGLVEAPTRLIEAMARELEVAHRYEATRHPFLGLLGKEVGEFRLVASSQSSQRGDAKGMNQLVLGFEVKRSKGEVEGFLPTLQLLADLGRGDERFGIIGKQRSGLANARQRFLRSIKRIQRRSEHRVPLAA